MKFDLIITNPPYDGEGDPLYMRITKALYDNCLNDLGKMISINPTGVVDTLYSDAKMKIYSDSLLLEDFDFDDRLRNAFSADIKSGIGIFTYSKYGKYRLDSDWVRSIRFGEKTWQMRKQIINKVGHFIGNGKGLTDITNFGMSNKNIVIINQHTGSKDLVTGKYKYDWPVLHSNQYLIVQTKLPEKPHFAIGFPVKEDAISFLKWINTDFVMFFVMTYKKHIRNTKTILALIPQPPTLDGNYSDEVLMKHFNLTREEMDWIHFEMKNFGWKVNLKKTEAELMAYIDEINRGGCKNMKFDIIIGNPAFNNGLDLKIHKVLEKRANKIVFVHPSGFAISHKDGVSKAECKDVDMSKFESLHLFWGNELFNIGLFVPVCVSIWKKDKVGNTVKVIDDAFTKTTYECDCNMVHLHGKMYPTIIDWFEKNVATDNVMVKHGKNEVTTEYGFAMSAVRGTPPRNGEGKALNDFFTAVPDKKKSLASDCVPIGTKSESNENLFSFNSEYERNNFINYCKSKCFRFLLSLFKTNQNLFRGELNQIPWMDFSKEWSDEALRKEWNIDDKLWDYIDKFIPDFYSDYHYDGIY